MAETQVQTPDGKKPAKYWHNQLDAATKRERNWRKRAERVVKRYMDERDGDTIEIASDDECRVNMLWSNTEVLKSVLFANLGKPDVSRNFPKQGKDNKTARQAALILERAISSSCDRYDPETEIEDAVTDYLLGGRGQCWLELEANIVNEELAEDNDEGIKPPEQAQPLKLAGQYVEICHVCYDDWTHGPGKKWEQVPWVARRHLMDKEDIAQQFGQDIADKVPMNFVLAEGTDRTQEQGQEDFKRAAVWEIWDKRSRSRIYVADGYHFELECTEDPYKLNGFFPCPKPLFGVKTPGTLIPRPEYMQYQDQCRELDRLNTRISRLCETLKLCGVYDASNDDDGTLANLGMLEDGEFLPFKNFQSLAQGGGLAAAFQTRDTAPYAQAIQVLAQRAEEIIQLIYEVTGISDVVRGATDPRETASAQRLKARFGTQRIQKRQKDVQRFVADLFKLKGELIAEHFTQEQLSEMSGFEIPTNAQKQMAQQIASMIQSQQQAAAQQQAMQQQAQQAQQQPQQGAPQPQQMAA